MHGLVIPLVLLGGAYVMSHGLKITGVNPPGGGMNGSGTTTPPITQIPQGPVIKCFQFPCPGDPGYPTPDERPRSGDDPIEPWWTKDPV